MSSNEKAEMPYTSLWHGHLVVDRSSRYKLGTEETKELLARLQGYAFPSGQELLTDLLAGCQKSIEEHRLDYINDAEGEGIWVRNPHGITCIVLDPSVKACQAFIDTIRSGKEFGTTA